MNKFKFDIRPGQEHLNNHELFVHTNVCTSNHMTTYGSKIPAYVSSLLGSLSGVAGVERVHMEKYTIEIICGKLFSFDEVARDIAATIQKNIAVPLVEVGHEVTVHVASREPKIDLDF
jgi:hypothetical protein